MRARVPVVGVQEHTAELEICARAMEGSPCVPASNTELIGQMPGASGDNLHRHRHKANGTVAMNCIFLIALFTAQSDKTWFNSERKPFHCGSEIPAGTDESIVATPVDRLQF